MHSEYIRICCIRDELDKLLLLKYSNTDITNIRESLYKITLELMNQCYDHVLDFDNQNSYTNKKYAKLEPFVLEQLKDMLFIKNKFIECFSSPGIKTKEDLLTYVLAFQITNNYYNEYLYSILVATLKKEVTLSFWKKYKLNRFEIDTDFSTDFRILRNTKNECSTGQIQIDINKGVNVFDKYISYIYTDNKPREVNAQKIDTIKEVSKALDNYYNNDFPFLNNPYRDSTLDLIDHIKVYQDFEKPKELIKRI